MNDETKDELMRRTREWLQSCVNAATRSGVPEEADLEAFILAHIDATPLGDELRDEREVSQSLREQLIAAEAERDALRAKYDELHTAAGNWLRQRDLAFDREEEEVRAQLRELREVAERNVADVQHLRQSSIALTDERDALRARVAELEAQNAEISTEARNLAYALEAADERQAEADKKLLDVHDSLHRECNGPVDLGREIRDMRSALEQRVGDLRKMYEKAEAQVAAARAECARIHDVYPMEDAYAAATDVLRAMDEATKK